MKILKYAGIGLLVLIALVLLLGLIQPTHFTYEKSIVIDASKEVVFDKINNLKSWEDWEPWQAQDTSMVLTYGDKTEGLGAGYSWVGDSKLSGTGKMTISESNPPSFVRTALEFEGQGTAEGSFTLEDAPDGGTNVTWWLGFDVPFPLNAFSIFTAGAMEKQMMEMFEKGLNKMKEICEAQAAQTYRGFHIQELDFRGATYVGMMGDIRIDPKAFEEFFAKSYGTLQNLITTGGLEMAGPPTGLYYTFDEERGITNMAAALPIKAGVAVSGGPFKLIELAAGKSLVIDYYGDYSGTAEAHYAFDDFMKEKGLEYNPPAIEQYLTDSGTEPDTSKWLTRIIYLLK